MKKHRNILSWTLIFVLLFSIMRNGAMLAFYLCDNKDFTELFCENKELPDLNCNGKCELSKMAKDQDGNAAKTLHFDFLKNELIYYTEISSFNFEIPILKSKQYFTYLNHYLFLYSKPINQPPVLV